MSVLTEQSHPWATLYPMNQPWWLPTRWSFNVTVNFSTIERKLVNSLLLTRSRDRSKFVIWKGCVSLITPVCVLESVLYGGSTPCPDRIVSRGSSVSTGTCMWMWWSHPSPSEVADGDDTRRAKDNPAPNSGAPDWSSELSMSNGPPQGRTSRKHLYIF